MEDEVFQLETDFDRYSYARAETLDIDTFKFNQLNVTSIEDVVELFDSIGWFVVSLLCAIVWIVYITFYSSRVTGLVLAKIANRFIKDGDISIGSISLSVLAGKIMFRDVAFTTEDFTLKVQDGWVIFRWWRAYVPKAISEDMSHSDTRLSILLNGFEYHLYNRCEMYSRLEKLFDLEPNIIPATHKNFGKPESVTSHPKPPSAVGYSWRDLIPVIKLELNSGRIVFGNVLTPCTLTLVVEEAHLIYTTKPADSKLDHFMHIIKCKGENFKVLLTPSPKFTGLKDDPPRLMGEGFAVLTTNKVEIYYYMDEPGIIPNDCELLELENGDLVEANPPIWGVDIKCGKGTDFSYGPWADRQRELLHKLFFPQDYQSLKPSSPPKPGDKRQVQSLDIRLSTLTEATVDILFSRDEETNAVHMNIGAGSYLEVTIPWLVLSDGYTTKITGQLLHVEASTSLQFRDFYESETLQFNVNCHYPVIWNNHQDWIIKLTGCKASAYLIYAHKWFFQALINDWSSRNPPDILSFIPYTCRINISLKEFELILPTNEYNWIDCSSQYNENSLLAACGELFDLSFDLPFHDFFPDTILFKFWIQVECGDLNFYIPEESTAYVSLHSLTKNSKVCNRDGSIRLNLLPSEQPSKGSKVKKWRHICQASRNWIECWSVPICAVSIAFTYHPISPMGPMPQADVTTPEKEEILLLPIRIPGETPKTTPEHTLIICNFDPLSLPPDLVHVELEVGPSDLLLYGSLLKLIINLKENVFGDYQDFINMEKLKSGLISTGTYKSNSSGQQSQNLGYPNPPNVDVREYRPLEVTVSATLHDIRAHLLKNCNERDPPCPTISIERFGFEMHKKYEETILQVLLSPAMLFVSDNLNRSESGDKHLNKGFLMLSGLQVRGNAMFSNEGRALDQETLEYAWLIEVQLGKLSGRLTTPQIEIIVASCEIFFLLAFDMENSLRSPHTFFVCHHGNNQFECPFDNNDNVGVSKENNDNCASPIVDNGHDNQLVKICPTSEDIKYKMVRVSIDTIDLYIVEGGSVLNIWVSPIRCALCNLHGTLMKEGFTLLISNVQIRQFITVNPSFTKRFQFSDLNIQSSSETMTASWTSKLDANQSETQSPASTGTHSFSYLWLEAGAISLGPLCVEVVQSGNTKALETQNLFLTKHDRKTRRLWLLWSDTVESKKCQPESGKVQPEPKKCACVGGTAFFGSNSGGQKFFWPSKKDWIDGLNVACFRVKSPGEDPGFGQSILKKSVLVFDTPPYTTQGVPLLDLHSEWNRNLLPKVEAKTPLIFKSSLLADLSHTSSSIPSNKSDRVSNFGSTMQSSKGRRLSQPNAPTLRRQSRINETTVKLEDGLRPNTDNSEDFISMKLSGEPADADKTTSFSSDSKIENDMFQSIDALDEISADDDLTLRRRFSKAIAGDIVMDDSGAKPWNASFTSLDSLSDVSFISALSVQEECMVNLQQHLKKPIAESSLLMPCYMSHLTQLKCDNWHITAPTVVTDSSPFVQSQDGKLIYAGSKFSPYFEPLVDGFTTLAMINVDMLLSDSNTPSLSRSWASAADAHSAPQDDLDNYPDDEFYRTMLCSDLENFESNFTSECITIIIRTKKDVNIMVSPMLLEAIEKLVQSLTPALTSVHPVTVINHLHNQCISRVENANLLKKEKSVLLMRIQNSKRNTAVRAEESSPVHSNLFEETILTTVQGSLVLPKINITVLQASVVEEVISFSALDNIRDLMCVSLLAVAIEQSTVHFIMREQIKKSVQVLYRPSILPRAQKKRKSKISASDSMLAEPVFIENSEKQSELISSSIDISRIHAQLRRLKNDSSILREAVITAIPNQHSKVLFKFSKIPCGLQEEKHVRESFSESSYGISKEATQSSVASTLVDDTSRSTSEKPDLPQINTQKCPDDKLGFIMCECGLEGISLKGIKNAELGQKQEKDETVSVTLCNETNPNLSATNLTSMGETVISDKETNTLVQNSKEDIPSLPDCIALTPQNPSPFVSTEFKVKEKQNKDKKPGPPNVSCVVQFHVMWYNFAAPPQTPITRKIDYTRVDWNLVSTASTAISAWLNPIDRLSLAIVSLLKGYSRRSAGLLASLMAEALEIQSIHQPPKSKYSKLTPVAKTLQDDPSCQLCVILRRFIAKTSIDEIEANVTEPAMPQLSTLRQGVIVLSRQWKNVLYTPLLLEHNLKSKKSKNFTVTFTLPQTDEESPVSDGEMSVEETTDERATLLDTELGTVSLQSIYNKRSRGSNASSLSELFVPNDHKVLPGQPFSSTRASDVYPMSPLNPTSNSFFNPENNDKAKRNRFSSVGSTVTGNWSTSSEEEVKAESGRSTPGTKLVNNSSVIRNVNEWNIMNDSHVYRLKEPGHEESLLLGAHSKFPQHPSLMLLDAHVIFQPLLTSMGLMPQQIIGYNFDNWGSHMSIRVSIEALKIDIVESEGKGYGSLRGKKIGNLNLPHESPAFLCEKISLDGDFQKSTDLSKDTLSKRSVIYFSRNYWKKQVKSSLVFCLNIDYISQQVNMPLLRLLHQITTMYQNVRETQLELRERRPSQITKRTLARKNSSSSGSEIHEPLRMPAEQFDSKAKSDIDSTLISAPADSTLQSFNTTTSTVKGSTTSRTQSFAQRFKSSNIIRGPKITVNGNIRSSSASQTPTSVRATDFPSTERRTPKPVINPGTSNVRIIPPHNCWKTIYALLDLYATRPETKTVFNARPPTLDTTDPIAQQRGARQSAATKTLDGKDQLDDAEKGQADVPVTAYVTSSLEKQKENGVEMPRLSIFGVAKIRRTRLLASLSGLKLEAEITNLQASSSFKKKLRPASVELSFTGHVGQAMIVLLEGAAPNQQTVVKVSIARPDILYCYISKRSRDKNCALLTIGPINIDIPQHPVVLHGMMTRSTKQLSNTLQEFRVNRTSSRISRGTTFDELDFAAHLTHLSQNPVPDIHAEKKTKEPETTFFQPLIVQFNIFVESLCVSAALLPSLQAQYKMELIKGCGITGNKANFKINLPAHNLSFKTKLTVSEANLPSAASISLPQIDVTAELVSDSKGPTDLGHTDVVMLRHGMYLSASASIGAFEHCLTTDLLNHLVFVQKVFMKEVNEVVFKMSGGDKPVPLWDEESSSPLRNLLFTLNVQLRGIQITATTPTNTAVRLETGPLEFRVSNRDHLKHNQTEKTVLLNSFSSTTHRSKLDHSPSRVYLGANVDVNLSLGQLIRNMVFEEAESDYQQYAFFKTHIDLRNTFSEESSSAADADKEVILIALTKPLIYVQPVAVDKAILVWLNYKNAYEYWNEQRSSLNTEVLAATHFQLTPDRIQPTILTEQSSILFLQLTVEDMGISIPLNPSPHIWTGRIEENRGAVVVTLDSTSISACSSGSLVSTGKFTGLCFRFSEDIMVTMDDWKPNLTDPNVLNFCVVSEGTYEVCSKTNSQHQQLDNANAKWFLNVKWSMEGVDMHVDVSVGKQLSALGHTLTTLAAFEEEDESNSYQGNILSTSQDLPDFPDEDSSKSLSQEFVVLRRQRSQAGDAPHAGDSKQKRNLLEKEMQERASFIEELQKTGASETKIEDERKKLQELENVAFKDFRRDWIKKLRRQSTKATSIRDKLGISSNKSQHMRSKSFVASSPVADPTISIASPGETIPSPSTENSPREGPSRSSSLRYIKSKQRVTFGETQRQYSVESASVTTPEDEDEDLAVWLDQDEGKESKDGIGQLTPGSSASHKAVEPNVDLELDVKVFINSGKCVLHTKAKDDDQEPRIKKRHERSGSGFDSVLHTGSPLGSRKSIKPSALGAKFKSPPGSVFGHTDVTVFHIPGLDVKIHYDSHVLYEEKDANMFPLGKGDGSFSGLGGGRKGGTKKASLFAWMTLHSVPEETIISPHILDFLEQTLEPIPMPLSQKNLDEISVNTEIASGAASTYYTSFPVDVVVYFHMQPSTFRFSCQPVSRVECMLRLPSLEIVFSSKRAEESDAFEKLLLSGPKLAGSKSKLLTELGSKELKDSQSIVGGISVTGCLSDFSLYIFHPYGAAKKTTGDWSPLSDNERKDSVSMNVEFIKFNLSRSRKVNIMSSTANVSDSKNFLQSNSELQQAAIRFSIIVDVGSASFKNDMRRLTEILAFPKAWYRRSIVRRLFLGDLSTVPGFGDEASVPDEYSGASTPSYKSNKRRNSGPGGLTAVQKEKLRLNLEGEKEIHRRGSKLDFFTGSKSSLKDNTKDQVAGGSKWETLVLFTVNFTKLNVQMNMGNVMGNVSWMIRDAKSDGRLAIGSSGHKNLYIGLGIDSSHIDAKGGIVAGTFEVVQFNSFIRAKEDTGTEPNHTVGFKMNGLELRLDFMGTSVLMGRVSDLEVVLRDEWQVRMPRRPQSDVAMATYRPAMIFIHGDMGWDQLQLIISKSTNVDLLKMHCKLEEFFSQQFKSSKWVFSTLNAQDSSPVPPQIASVAKRSAAENGIWEENHNRHWHQVLDKVSLMSVSSLVNPFPVTGTVLGGTMDLHGSNISLACFHGINFKAKSWALFSLKEPFISFSTEAQETHSQDAGGVHIVQNLNFSLGQNSQQTMTITNAPHESMAMVCRITRNVMFPPQFRTLHEWFHYAFAPGEIDDVQRFPSLERERERVDRERNDPTGRASGRLHDPNHNREVIFALPSMELFFKTEHLQAIRTLGSTEISDRPEIECSFITEFADHIFVTVDAEAFFFLHDLITSYIKEKDKLVSAQLAAGRSQNSNTMEGRENHSNILEPSDTREAGSSTVGTLSVGDLEESFQRDWRSYHCKTWQLEPTVRLWSWAGKSIEPYGVDYILHKLGFSHARITIPKWMQRGFMDPLDKLLSLLVFQMIDLAKSDQDREQQDERKVKG